MAISIRRNDQCPCGSGRKYKVCCLAADQACLAGTAHPARPAEEPRFGGMRPEQFLALEQSAYEAACEIDRTGQHAINAGNYAEARMCFLRAIELCPELPFWYNNQALAEFHSGQVEAARALCRHVVNVVDPTNVFARCMLTQCAWIVGDAAELARSMAELGGLQPPDPSVLVKLLETYGRFSMHHEILSLVDAYPDLVERDARFFAGIAAANTGDLPRAVRELKRAAKGSSRLADRARYFEDFARRGLLPPTIAGRFSYVTSFSEIMPPAVWEQAVSAIRTAVATHELDDERNALRPEHLPGSADALVACLREQLDDEGDADDMPAPLALMAIAGFIGNTAAAELLRDIATGTFGSEQLRFEAMQQLRRLGSIGAGDTLPMTVYGKQTEVFVQDIELDESAGPAPLPPVGMNLLVAAYDAMRAGDLEEAERVMCDLISMYPHHPIVRQNLAAVLGQLDRHEEALELQRETVALVPDYLPGRTTLMLALAEAGDVAAATQMMRDYDLPTRMHPDHYAGYLAAQSVLALHDEPPSIDDARRMLDMAHQISPGNAVLPIADEMLDAIAAVVNDFGHIDDGGYPADPDRRRLAALVTPIIREISESGEPGNADKAAAVEPLHWFIQLASEPKGMPLTARGNVGVKIVQAADERYEWYHGRDHGWKARTEQDLGELTAVRELAIRLRFIRKQRNALVATKLGRGKLGDAAGMWDAAVRSLLAPPGEPADFLYDAREVILAILLAEDHAGEVTVANRLADLSGDMLSTRWDMSVVDLGDGRESWDGYWREMHEALDPLRALGMLKDNRRRMSSLDDPWIISLTAIGKAAAAIALRERLQPAAIPGG